MREKLVFATGNQNKMKEIREILSDLDLEICSMKEAQVDIDITEDGTTFTENALIKARAVAERLKKTLVMADDSGLEIDYLNKEPGIYSARYMGEDTSCRIKNANLIERLAGVPKEKRTARFVCAIAGIMPDGEEITTLGVIEGYIGYEERGSNGFGYDPVFYLYENDKSTAELSEEDKNAISHRGKALKLMEAELQRRMCRG